MHLKKKTQEFFSGLAHRSGFHPLSGWVRAYFDPSGWAADHHGSRPPLAETAAGLFLFYFGFFIVFYVVSLLLFLLFQGTFAAVSQSPFDLSFALQVVLLSPIFNTLALLFMLLLALFSAKMLGGKAHYSLHAYSIASVFCGWMSVLTFLMVPTVFLLALLQVIGQLPVIGLVLSLAGNLLVFLLMLAMLAFFVYGFYSFYRMIRRVHDLSPIRAAGVIAGTAAMVVLLNALLERLAG